MSLREATGTKAARLVDQDRVRPLNANVFLVDGDHDVYVVTIVKHGARTYRICALPNGSQHPMAPGVVCSHVQAASRFLMRQAVPEDPFTGLGPNH